MRIGPFEIYEPVPSLHEPHALAMLRPWIDVGGVGGLVLTRLERHFGGREMGKLARPGNFFDFTRYRPMVSVTEGKREIAIPNTFINYAKREGSHDFIFLHLLEPHMFGEDYTEGILEILKQFGVKRYMQIGAMYDAVPHTRKLLVTGSARGGPRELKFGDVQMQGNTYQGPTSINTVVSQKAPDFGIEVASLMAHLPQYVQLEEDYAGAARVLEILQGVYGLPPGLIDPRRGQVQYEEITKAVASNPRLIPVIKDLEASYDARNAPRAPEEEAPAAPFSREVEDFLRKIDEDFKKPGA